MSREPLSIGGEVVWPVPGLSLPDQQTTPKTEKTAGSEPVSLFVERARAVRPSFALTGQNAWAVAEVCVQLDGMPLAIDLAAARVRMLAPAGIAERLSDRFRCCLPSAAAVRRPGTNPCRQRSPRASTY